MSKKIISIIICALLACGVAVTVFFVCRSAGMSASADGTISTQETEETTSYNGYDSDDNTAPVITGVNDITVHIGETIAYKKNVVVTDDKDPDPQLTVLTDGIDITVEGTYKAIYIATDASGNSAMKTAVVNVVSAEHVTSDEVYALVDDILDEIITDDMTDYEKLYTVWKYIHIINYVDVDYAEAEDYMENAYYFLSNRRGNCRCTYASSRVFAERLGYDVMMIKNQESAALTHYWTLISVDGGTTWYHFDPTCWEWEDDDIICMVCDDFIQDYSERHDKLCYDWDTDLYPATSDKNMQE